MNGFVWSLQRLESGPLSQICEEAVDTAERAAAMNSEVEAEHLLSAELRKLQSKIEEASKSKLFVEGI